jgi:hypothetical protein
MIGPKRSCLIQSVFRMTLMPMRLETPLPFQTRREVARYFGGKTIRCRLCGQRFRRVGTHLAAKHDMSANESAHQTLAEANAQQQVMRRPIKEVRMRQIVGSTLSTHSLSCCTAAARWLQHRTASASAQKSGYRDLEGRKCVPAADLCRTGQDFRPDWIAIGVARERFRSVHRPS